MSPQWMLRKKKFRKFSVKFSNDQWAFHCIPWALACSFSDFHLISHLELRFLTRFSSFFTQIREQNLDDCPQNCDKNTENYAKWVFADGLKPIEKLWIVQNESLEKLEKWGVVPVAVVAGAAASPSVGKFQENEGIRGFEAVGVGFWKKSLKSYEKSIFWEHKISIFKKKKFFEIYFSKKFFSEKLLIIFF